MIFYADIYDRYYLNASITCRYNLNTNVSFRYYVYNQIYLGSFVHSKISFQYTLLNRNFRSTLTLLQSLAGC